MNKTTIFSSHAIFPGSAGPGDRDLICLSIACDLVGAALFAGF